MSGSSFEWLHIGTEAKAKKVKALVSIHSTFPFTLQDWWFGNPITGGFLAAGHRPVKVSGNY